MRIRPALATTATIVLLTAGCNGYTSQPTPQPSVDSTAPAPRQATPPDAKTVLDQLVAAKVGLSNPAAQTEDTDPNNLLGRPGGYLSRASADLPGGDKEAEKGAVSRGLVVEVFPTTEDVDRRAKHIQDALKNMPILGTEYQYRPKDGRILVRVSGLVKPSQAKKVEQAVAGL